MPATLQAICDAVDRNATGRAYDDEPVVEREKEEVAGIVGKLGVIYVTGIIGQHLSGMEMGCGGYDLAALNASLDEMEADPRVESVLLVMNTPGGTVTGVPEAAARVRDFSKPVSAFTDSMSASAGYWIASQADRVFITPSAEYGSIGVYSAVVDESAAWAKEGFKLELMKAGKHKAAGIAGLPLSDEDKALIQGEVDELYTEFKGAVSARRKAVSDGAMQGQMFRGQKAVDAGLADEIVGSLQELIRALE